MFDPQDLLYTNKFITTDILSDKQLTNETQYYDRFTNYITNKNDTELKNYIENNEHELDPINLNKTLNKKWPIENNRNHYPLFDTYINDISSNKYSKEKITKVNIDSANRDVSAYFSPNNFNLLFPRTFNSIYKIVINDICIKNTNRTITNIYNCLAWQFASGDYLVGTNIDLNIIPVPDATRKISYTNLPYSVYIYKTANPNFLEDNNLVYQVPLPDGYYSVDDIIVMLRKKSCTVLHGDNINKNITEQPYYSFPSKIGNPNLFTFKIDPVSNVVKCVNRMEELNIIAIQTFSPDVPNNADNDIFYNYSSLGSTSLDPTFIYITLSASTDNTYLYYPNQYNTITPSAFPLVITGMTNDVGNILWDSINYTEFFDLNIYTNNNLYNESDLTTISYYKFSDYININSNKIYLRFAFKISTGNYRGFNYNASGYQIVPITNENIVFSNVLDTFLSKHNSDLVEYSYRDHEVIIGRAILFRWIFDRVNGVYVNYESDTYNQKKKSVLNILAWPIANPIAGIYAIGINNGYRFVHTNLQYYLISKSQIDNYDLDQNISNSIVNPQKRMNITYYSNQYYIVNQNYIYLKIAFNTNDNIVSQDPIINAFSNSILQYNQTYVDGYYFNVGIGEDYTCVPNNPNVSVKSIDTANIFAKILVSNIPGNTDTTTSNIINNNSFSINYEAVIDNIDNITVSLYDSKLQLMETKSNYSFTLNIYEKQNILKETLINTKLNSVNTTGYTVS